MIELNGRTRNNVKQRQLGRLDFFGPELRDRISFARAREMNRRIIWFSET